MRRIPGVFPICWEQQVLYYLLKPFLMLALLLRFISWPAFKSANVSTLNAIARVMNVLITPIVGVITWCSKASNAVDFLRPVSFLLALPFLAFGYTLLFIQPVEPEENTEKKLRIMFFPKEPPGLIPPNKLSEPTP